MILTIVMIFILITIFYNFCKYDQSANDDFENFKNDKDTISNEVYFDKIGTIPSYLLKKKNNKKIKKDENKINAYFIENQYNNDYRDILNAIVILSPDQKVVFNRQNLPIINNERPTKKDTNMLVTNIIKTINKTIKQSVNIEHNKQSWNDNMEEKRNVHGWEKQMKKLGLPTSLFMDPAKKSSIRLLKIDNVEKEETEDEIRYVIHIIIKKNNTNDQMLLKICIVMDNKLNSNGEIEELFVVGYLTTNNENKYFKEDYNNYDTINKDGIFDYKNTMKELNDKRKKYQTHSLELS